MKLAITVVLSLIVLAVIVISVYGQSHEIINMLPPSATDIRQNSDAVFSCHPDSYYAMRAKISEEDFLSIVRTLELSKDEMQFDRISFGLPSGHLGAVDRDRVQMFYRLKSTVRSHRVIAAYQDGYIYFEDTFGY